MTLDKRLFGRMEKGSQIQGGELECTHNRKDLEGLGNW